MDCPRCRHWVPDRTNFCQTCGHQFAHKVVRSRAPRFAVILFLLSVLVLTGAYLLVRLNSSSTGSSPGQERGERNTQV
jgi:hypothetical protein